MLSNLEKNIEREKENKNKIILSEQNQNEKYTKEENHFVQAFVNKEIPKVIKEWSFKTKKIKKIDLAR